MSKEAHGGATCACGRQLAYPEQHWPHCEMNPANMSAKTQDAGAHLLKTLQAKFSKSELETISRHGPVRDQPVAAKRKGKSNTKSTKRSIR